MLTNLFESRNKTFLNLVKIGDYLSRSLRENVEIFSVNENTVSYITENGKILKANFSKDSLKLSNITLENTSVLEDKNLYSKAVDRDIEIFVSDIINNDLPKAQDSFNSILNLWETRLLFDKIKLKLQNKQENFNESLRIIDTPEFSMLFQVRGDLVKMLKESDTFIEIPEIRNTIRLSSVISKSFNLPRIDYIDLAESKVYEIPATINHNLYEHLCKQELVAKELINSKSELDNLWIINENIQKLPSFIYESSNNIAELISKIIIDVPYFAMASKKQISYLIEGNLDLLANKNIVSASDIKSFVSKIFEFKKPVKLHIINILNEKYGINIQNLVDAPTLTSLSKTQVTIFESLARLSPKNSILKKILYEFSQCLKTKNGIELIDVSDFLLEIFEECNYTSVLNETSLMNYLNFDKVADDLGKIGSVLKMIKAGMDPAAAMGGASPLGGADPSQGNPVANGPVGSDMAQQTQPGDTQYASDEGDMAGDPSMMGDEELDPMQAGEDGGGGAIPAEDVAAGIQADEMQDPNAEPMEAEQSMSKDALIDNMRELEMLIATLKDEIGVEDEMPIDGEMPPEDEMPIDGEMPPEEEMPVDGEMPPEDEMPVDGEMPPEKEMPPEEEKIPPSLKKKKKK